MDLGMADCLPLAEIANVLACFNHFASVIVHATWLATEVKSSPTGLAEFVSYQLPVISRHGGRECQKA